MAYLKPQNPIKSRDGDCIYPLTTIDQVIMPDGGRLNTKVLKPKAGFIYPLASANVPEGFLLCDGAAYSRTEYPELFAAIGTIYGTGDGSTTFNVPNLATRVPVGKGNGYALGATGGEEQHTLTEAELPNITGQLQFRQVSNGGQIVSTYSNGNGNECFTYNANAGDKWGYALTSTNNTSDTNTNSVIEMSFGGSQPHNNMQPYTVVNYIIATGKDTGVSVQDVIAGTQALPLGVEYGGTGATNTKTARENLEITPDNIGAMSMELLWENASPKSEFVAQTISLNLGGYDGILVTMYTTLSNYYMSTPCFAFKKTKENQLIARDSGSIITRYFIYDDYSITFKDCGQVKTYGSSPTVVNGYMIPCTIYGIKGVST